MAICSGFIILLFIHGFDAELSGLEYFKRWFIGILVATINIVFSGLFYSKWCEAKKQKSLEEKLKELGLVYGNQNNELTKIKVALDKSKTDFNQLFICTEELESFKAKEIQKLTCPYCQVVHENIYQLTSHKGRCQMNVKEELQLSINGQSKAQSSSKQYNNENSKNNHHRTRRVSRKCPCITLSLPN